MNTAFVALQLLQAILCKTYILYSICIDTGHWFFGSLVFLDFCKWLFYWTSSPAPASVWPVANPALLQACGPLWQHDCGYAKEANGVCYEMKTKNSKIIELKRHNPISQGENSPLLSRNALARWWGGYSGQRGRACWALFSKSTTSGYVCFICFMITVKCSCL